ncbi:MAG: DUF4190 domain-containing protein [Anaerolineaceae bacterium]|nr:DUF4190 domain-containing protein [Anaerolineaceae bacterium]
MAIQFICPSCQQAVTVAEQYAGGQVFCPTCRAELTVPGVNVSSQVPVGQPGGPPSLNPGGPPAGAKRSAAAVASLVLSLIAWLACPLGFVFSFPGLLLGLIGRAKVKRSGGALTGRGAATAGVIISLLHLLLVAAIVVGIAGFAPWVVKMGLSGARMARVGLACDSYLAANSTMPPDLQTLVTEDYLDSADMLTCPASGEPYVYVAASMSSGDIDSGTVIVYSTFELPDNRGRLVLFRGPRVEVIPGDQLRKKLRDQGLAENLIP